MPPRRKVKETHRQTTISASASASTSTPISTSIFPLHIISDILSRLPVKTLLRFKCVCKIWRTLISCPGFICQHLDRSPPSLIIHALETDLRYPKRVHKLLDINATGHVISLYKFPNLHRNMHPDPVRVVEYPGTDASCFKSMDIVGCPNGVVCLIQQPWACNITLWNPATRSSKLVSSPCLQADPSVHRMASAGLGFDPSTNDYKIIRIMCRELGSATPDTAEVYSINSGHWRHVKLGANIWVSRTKCHAVIKGTPYWRAVGYDDDLSIPRFLLVYFDVQKEVFGVETMAWVMENWIMYMGEIKGCLSAVVWEKETKMRIDRVLDVWIKEDESGWSKIYRVEPASVLGIVVGFYGDKGIVEEVGNEGNLIMYNLEKMEVEDFINVEKVLPGTFNVVNYRESLVTI